MGRTTTNLLKNFINVLKFSFCDKSMKIISFIYYKFKILIDSYLEFLNEEITKSEKL